MKEEKKGLWAQMNEGGNIVKWPPDKPLTNQDIEETFELIRKQDNERRERMDKEYTDISEITNEEIDKVIADYGGIDNVPNGLFVKVKIGGSYMDMPVKTLHQLKEAAQREWDKQNKK